MSLARLNDQDRATLLKNNEGYTTHTSCKLKNFSESNTYTIKNGKVMCRSQSNTSWADSRRDDTYELDAETTKRFLRDNLHALDKSGIN